MANVVTHIPTGVHIVLDGSTDLDFATYYPNGILWTGLELTGSAGDEVTIRSKTATGVPIAHIVVDTDTPGVGSEKWKEHYAFPYIKATDVILTDVTKAYLIVRYI